MHHLTYYYYFLYWFSLSGTCPKHWLGQVDKQLSEASNDSTRILAYYKVASEIYRSNPQEAQEIVSKVESHQ
jgi:hypothetical protein